jgi:N-acetylneuraminic acid mutarotase
MFDGKVLFTGGYPGNDGQGDPTTLALSEFFDPVAGTWEIVGNMDEARDGHTATLLPDGNLLVAGGYNWNIRFSNYNLPLYVGSAELYDPAAGTWMAVANLVSARYGHTATLLQDGSVLLVGGEGPEGTLASAELYVAPPADGCQ